MQFDIAIVIAAYNRPDSLKRLLDSVAKADYNGYTAIRLIISIDHSDNSDCKKIADAFTWNHGEKKVVHHPQNLGLKQHILSCGDYSQYHDAVIVLEDDLYVSCAFYDYAQQAYSFYKNDERIAGIALYHNTFNEVACCPFEPLHDGYDGYFMQVPCSWGQLWNRRQWDGFISYFSNKGDKDFDSLPASVQRWPTNSSWKKIFYSYLTETDKYFVYPRIGLSTNFGDAGQHLTSNQTAFQTSLLLAKKEFHFSSLDESLSIYDGFFELEGKVYNKFADKQMQVSFDLNGTKPLAAIRSKYLLSSKKCVKPIQRFSIDCYPYENNIMLGIAEEKEDAVFFSLGKTSDFSEKALFNRLSFDLKRVFLTDAFVRNSVRVEVEQSKEFRLGSMLFKPMRVTMNFLKKIIK